MYHDGFGPHASLLEQAALNTNRAVGPSDRLKQMLSLCAHTVREVDNYFDDKFSTQPCMYFNFTNLIFVMLVSTPKLLYKAPQNIMRFDTASFHDPSNAVTTIISQQCRVYVLQNRNYIFCA